MQEIMKCLDCGEPPCNCSDSWCIAIQRDLERDLCHECAMDWYEALSELAGGLC